MIRNKTIIGGLAALVGTAVISFGVGNYSANSKNASTNAPSTTYSAPAENTTSDLYSEMTMGGEDQSNPDSDFSGDYTGKARAEEEKGETAVERFGRMLEMQQDFFAREARGEKVTYEEQIEFHDLTGKPFEYATKEDYEAGIKAVEPEDGALMKTIMTDENKAAAKALYEVGKEAYETFKKGQDVETREAEAKVREINE